MASNNVGNNQRAEYQVILPQLHFTDSDRHNWRTKQIVPKTLTMSDIDFSNKHNWNHSHAGNIFPDLKSRQGTLRKEINIRFANGNTYHYPVGTSVLIQTSQSMRRHHVHTEGAPVNGTGHINWNDNMLVEGREDPVAEPVAAPAVAPVAPAMNRDPTNRRRCNIQGESRKYRKQTHMNRKNKSRKNRRS